MIRVAYARWGQSPQDLRSLALSAPHARTRERALALFDITQHRCASQVAGRTGRRAHTVLGRVGGDVAIPAPHRPGRADFPHPVLQERALLPTV
ncbi:MAG TPA: hypothetical protein VKG87_10020 [Terriglobales bacterium]|nr:hypothetical protein [Terriglobales bacterium]